MTWRQRMRRLRPALALPWLLVAGQGWAGDAWRAEYEVREGKDRHVLVVVRDETRVEYQGDAGTPLRIWRRLDDGIERTEVFVDRHAVVVASPGDLRTLDELPAWDTLVGIVPAGLRDRLQVERRLTRFDRPATRREGRLGDGQPVRLEWIDDIGLPAAYRSGDYRLCLRSLQRVPADDAFTATAGLRSYDRADLGDMPLDPFARDYLDRFGKHRHAH